VNEPCVQKPRDIVKRGRIAFDRHFQVFYVHLMIKMFNNKAWVWFLCCAGTDADGGNWLGDEETHHIRLDQAQTSKRTEPTSGAEMSREEERKRRQHA